MVIGPARVRAFLPSPTYVFCRAATVVHTPAFVNSNASLLTLLPLTLSYLLLTPIFNVSQFVSPFYISLPGYPSRHR